MTRYIRNTICLHSTQKVESTNKIACNIVQLYFWAFINFGQRFLVKEPLLALRTVEQESYWELVWLSPVVRDASLSASPLNVPNTFITLFQPPFVSPVQQPAQSELLGEIRSGTRELVATALCRLYSHHMESGRSGNRHETLAPGWTTDNSFLVGLRFSFCH